MTYLPSLPRLRRGLFWLVLFLGQFVSLAWISWHLLAQIHFAYPLGYQLLNLQEHIAHYAPLNRYKTDFDSTTPADHWRLFGEISDAVQHSGKGLAAIHYSRPDGTQVPLMHEAEIVHLQDVAQLIDRFYQVGGFCVLVWLMFVAIASWKKYSPPTHRQLLSGFLLMAGVIASVILLIGPTAVFYWLHVQIFPADHQWFFYYEESLMTTLMKAPDIFAFITLLWLGLLILGWCLASYLLHRVVYRH